jgi:hypothetical protein
MAIPNSFTKEKQAHFIRLLWSFFAFVDAVAGPEAGNEVSRRPGNHFAGDMVDVDVGRWGGIFGGISHDEGVIGEGAAGGIIHGKGHEGRYQRTGSIYWDASARTWRGS